MDDFFGRTLKLRSVGTLFRCHKSRAGKLLQTEQPKSKARTVEMVLFPNPTDDQVTVTLPADAAPKWRLEVWNSSGVAVRSFEIGSNQHDFNLENLSAGFYVVKAINKVEPLQLQQRLIVR